MKQPKPEYIPWIRAAVFVACLIPLGHLVWQGFRGKNCNIFLKTFDGSKWSADVRVTHRAANDWEPAVAFDGKGTAWPASGWTQAILPF